LDTLATRILCAKNRLYGIVHVALHTHTELRKITAKNMIKHMSDPMPPIDAFISEYIRTFDSDPERSATRRAKRERKRLVKQKEGSVCVGQERKRYRPVGPQKSKDSSGLKDKK
jgi:hypothetical protein